MIKYTHWICVSKDEFEKGDFLDKKSNNFTEVTNRNYFYDWKEWEKLAGSLSNDNNIILVTEEEV